MERPRDGLNVRCAARSLGLAVPGDLSVVTFGSRLPFDIGVRVTSMVIPDFETGQTAARLMVRKLRNSGRPVKSECVLTDRNLVIFWIYTVVFQFVFVVSR